MDSPRYELKMIEMALLEPGLLRDLTEAKADLARHGVVILRTIETDLEPAIMSAVKSSMASSPRSMDRMDEGELDNFLERLRKTSKKSIDQLRTLYVRLLAKLGSGQPEDIAKELDGIEQLIKWSRVARVVEPVNEELVGRGFAPIELADPEDLSESFKVELEQKWPASFERFKGQIGEAVKQLAKGERADEERAAPTRTKKVSRRR